MIPPITIAFDTTSGGFAFAVLQGRETLLDWACSQAIKTKPDAWRGRVEKLFARYEPDLIVLPDVEDSHRGKWAKQFMSEIASLAKAHGIDVRLVSRHDVQKKFSISGSTKYEIAVAVSRVFPELAPRLPRQRKPWMSEDRRMGIFDAMSFALTELSQ